MGPAGSVPDSPALGDTSSELEGVGVAFHVLRMKDHGVRMRGAALQAQGRLDQEETRYSWVGAEGAGSQDLPRGTAQWTELNRG